MTQKVNDQTVSNEDANVAIQVAVNNGFATNSNYKGIDEKTAIIKAGLKYSEPINRSLIINSVELVPNNGNPFYSIKADDAISDKPADCSISVHHYESFNFNELLPIGKHSGKVVKVKGIFADTNTGYCDKTGKVFSYWKTSFFITEPRSEVTAGELAEKRAIDNEVTSLEKKLERLLNCKFDYTNESHLKLLSAMSK